MLPPQHAEIITLSTITAKEEENKEITPAGPEEAGTKGANSANAEVTDSAKNLHMSNTALFS